MYFTNCFQKLALIEAAVAYFAILGHTNLIVSLKAPARISFIVRVSLLKNLKKTFFLPFFFFFKRIGQKNPPK